MSLSTRRSARLPLLQYLAAAVTWGASFLFIKIGLEGLSAGQVVLGRVGTGAITLLLISALTRPRLPREPAVWAHLAFVSVLLCVIPFLLFSWAEERISSGLASIYNATTPLMTVLVALVALRQERMTRAQLLGLAAGFLGVLVVLGPWRGLGGGSALAQGGCLLATLSYGATFVYLRRFISPRNLPALSIATIQVSFGAVIMLLLTPVVATAPTHLSPRIVFSILALGSLGTGAAYVWNTNVIAAWGATNASTVTYLTPLVGVVLGIVVLDEHLHWNEPVGAVLVVLGIAISQNRLAVRRPAPADPVAERS